MDQYWTTVKMESICVFFFVADFLFAWLKRKIQTKSQFMVGAWCGFLMLVGFRNFFGSTPQDAGSSRPGWHLIHIFLDQECQAEPTPQGPGGLDHKLFNRKYHPHCWWLPIFFFRPSTLGNFRFLGWQQKKLSEKLSATSGKSSWIHPNVAPLDLLGIFDVTH